MPPKVIFWPYDTKASLEDLEPTPFIPGTNLLAVVNLRLRERTKEATWSTLGIRGVSSRCRYHMRNNSTDALHSLRKSSS
jgi:hypothetical protein